MLDLVVFSKDRACQLDLLLRSVKTYFEGWEDVNLQILYTHSSDDFARGYELVRSLHPEVRWVCERDQWAGFKELTLGLLGNLPYVAFLVDDDVFKNPFTLAAPEVRMLRDDPQIMCASLRLCPRLDYVYTLDRPMARPQFERGTVWSWTHADAAWAYPMSVDGHIFRSAELLPLLRELEFHNPNTLEARLAENPLPNPKMVCFEESKIVNIPANRVQDTYENRHAGISAEALNEAFLAGGRLSLDAVAGIENRSCHEEIPLSWEGEDERVDGIAGLRAFRTVVLADEIVSVPELLGSYARAFAPADDATLVIYAPDSEPAAVEAALTPVLAELRLDGPSAPDMMALAVPRAEGERALAGGADALLCFGEPAGALAELPRFAPHAVNDLRAEAERVWSDLIPLGAEAPAAATAPAPAEPVPPQLAADPAYASFLADLEAYRALPGAEQIGNDDLFPQLHDKTPTTPYDGHYFFQDIWAARRVADLRPARHVDVGSRVDYAGFLTALTEVTFVDIRPLDVELEGFTSIAGSALELPYADRSVESLSCLHVIEHIGLGRYGDPLDPDGLRKALREFQRVLAPGGQLLVSTPVGRRRTAFNAHRISDPHDIPALLPELELVEFSGVDDRVSFRRHRSLDELAGADYACGMYLFRRPGATPAVTAAPVPATQALAAYPSSPPDPTAKREHLLSVFRERGHTVLLESGTYLGETVEYFVPHAQRIISVEVEPKLFADAQRKFQGVGNVELVLGDSLHVIPQIVAALGAPALIWLDGHFSEGVTGKGDEIEPAASILERLGATRTPPGTTIVVDDLRLFGRLPDFPSLEELLARARAGFPGARISVGLDSLVIEA